MKLSEIGPFQRTNGTWEYMYMPVLTGQCNLCADCLGKGRLPGCVQACQANCLQLLDAEDAAGIAAANPKMLMMTL